MTSGKQKAFVAFMFACACLFAALGVWQIKRLHWKENIIAQQTREYAKDASQFSITAKDIEKLPAQDIKRGVFTGTFQFDKTFKLSGQIDAEKPSRHIIVPLQIDDLNVLVDFGPTPKEGGFKLPPGRTQKATITGLVKPFPRGNFFTPANNAPLEIWYSLDAQQLTKTYQLNHLTPHLILPETTPWGNFNAARPEIRNAHLQYACFWFALAVMTLVMTGVYLRKPNRHPRDGGGLANM